MGLFDPFSAEPNDSADDTSSADSSGKELNLDDYLKFCRELIKEHRKNVKLGLYEKQKNSEAVNNSRERYDEKVRVLAKTLKAKKRECSNIKDQEKRKATGQHLGSIYDRMKMAFRNTEYDMKYGGDIDSCSAKLETLKLQLEGLFTSTASKQTVTLDSDLSI